MLNGFLITKAVMLFKIYYCLPANIYAFMSCIQPYVLSWTIVFTIHVKLYILNQILVLFSIFLRIHSQTFPLKFVSFSLLFEVKFSRFYLERYCSPIISIFIQCFLPNVFLRNISPWSLFSRLTRVDL